MIPLDVLCDIFQILNRNETAAYQLVSKTWNRLILSKMAILPTLFWTSLEIREDKVCIFKEGQEDGTELIADKPINLAGVRLESITCKDPIFQEVEPKLKAILQASGSKIVAKTFERDDNISVMLILNNLFTIDQHIDAWFKSRSSFAIRNSQIFMAPHEAPSKRLVFNWSYPEGGKHDPYDPTEVSPSELAQFASTVNTNRILPFHFEATRTPGWRYDKSDFIMAFFQGLIHIFIHTTEPEKFINSYRLIVVRRQRPFTYPKIFWMLKNHGYKLVNEIPSEYGSFLSTFEFKRSDGWTMVVHAEKPITIDINIKILCE